MADQQQEQQQQQQQQQLGGMAAMTAAAEAHSASRLDALNPSLLALLSPSPIATRTASSAPGFGQSYERGLKHRKCQAPGCSTQCNFGFPGSRALFCFTHKLEGHTNVNHRICQAEGCQRLANFSHPGEKAKFCGTHKLEGMQSRHKRPTCEEPGCPRQPVFGYPGQSRRSCSAHRLPGMESKTFVRQCRGSGCGKSAGFNFPEAGSKADYCEEHRVQGMVSLRARECETGGCSKRACFRFGTGTVAIYCAAHQQTNAGSAIPPSNLRAQEVNHTASGDPSRPPQGRSRRQPSPSASGAAMPSSPTSALAAALGLGGFTPGAGAGAGASTAAAAGVMTTVDARCEHPGCWRDPVFAGHADPGRWPRFCQVHRMDALADFSIVRCSEDACYDNASWGYYCGGQATKCGTHRLSQMVDVKARRCRRGGCSRVPYFAHATSTGEGASFCSLHKTEAMLDVKSQRCSVEGCENLPLDNTRGEVPSSTCREHGAAWNSAVETGFPNPITDADTAEAATVVASLWADAIGGDWSVGGGGGGGGGGAGGGSGTTDGASSDRGYAGGLRGRREQ